MDIRGNGGAIVGGVVLDDLVMRQIKKEPETTGLVCVGAVGCEVPTPTGIELVTQGKGGGFKSISNKVTMVKMKVLVPDSEYKYPKDTYVYVMADTQNHNWFTAVYKIDDVEFIMVPIDGNSFIKMTSRK